MQQMNFLANCGINPPVCRWEMAKKIRDCFSEAFGLLLKQRGMSQKDFAEAIGVTDSSVSRWVRGKELPSYPTLDRIAEFFNVHPMFLFSTQDTTFPTGNRRVILDLEKLAEDSGFKLTPKDG